MLAYEPGRTAILDDICIVHPYDELQQALQVALATPSTPSKLLAPTWLPYWSQTADDQPKVGSPV